MQIAVEGLACRRSERHVFSDVSFTLRAGEALAVTGRNGAGKSSLLAILAGRLAPAAGAVRAEGLGERSLPESLHLVGHRDGLKTALSGAENLSFARDLLGDPALSPAEALDAVGLGHAADFPVGYLSAGQRRRVALARLLVAHRPLWLLDEPFTALDAAAQGMLLTLLQAHLAAGGLVIAATHQPLGIAAARELRLGVQNPSPLRRGAGVGGVPPCEPAGEDAPGAVDGGFSSRPPPPAPPRKGEGR